MIKTDAIIIGAGPVGLFAVHQLGIKGLKSEVIDNLDKPGGQCIELYPDKPIYDIPALSVCSGKSLTEGLLQQIKPFGSKIHLNERVQQVKEEKNYWIITTNKGQSFQAPNIIIAGGVGSFEPRKLPLKELEKFEGKSVFYSITNKEIFSNKKICIFGGGDSALDWALELSKNSKITLIHRRDQFRGAPHTLSELEKLKKNGKISIKTPYTIDSINTGDKLNQIIIKNDNGEKEKIDTDFVLGFFGLIMQLGPISEWGLNMTRKTIDVNTHNFQSNKPGIFAIGDICNYPGKLKLILSGFHEAALASVECFKRARPKEKFRFEFTTSSKEIQSRLGVKTKMIEVLTANTPNGKKITIMLEEIGYDYKITKININKNEQFKSEFEKLSPFRKTPVIVDHKNNISLFETGAILIYLAEQSGKFYDEKKNYYQSMAFRTNFLRRSHVRPTSSISLL